MGSTFHQLCPRYRETLIPTAPTAIRLWKPLPDLDDRNSVLWHSLYNLNSYLSHDISVSIIKIILFSLFVTYKASLESTCR